MSPIVLNWREKRREKRTSLDYSRVSFSTGNSPVSATSIHACIENIIIVVKAV